MSYHCFHNNNERNHGLLQNILFIFADMKRIIATFAALAALIPAFSQEVWEISPKDYEISNSDLRKAKEIITRFP